MKSDTEDYLDLLTRLNATLDRLRQVLSAHDVCPGCNLCLTCRDVLDTLDVSCEVYFHDMGLNAPNAAMEQTEADVPAIVGRSRPAG